MGSMCAPLGEEPSEPVHFSKKLDHSRLWETGCTWGGVRAGKQKWRCMVRLPVDKPLCGSAGVGVSMCVVVQTETHTWLHFAMLLLPQLSEPGVNLPEHLVASTMKLSLSFVGALSFSEDFPPFLRISLLHPHPIRCSANDFCCLFLTVCPLPRPPSFFLSG